MISVQGLSMRQGAFELGGVSFEIPAGAYGVLMGKTGSGKTSILEAICGLRTIRAGRIEVAGRNVTALKPCERGIGYVPQDRALFSTMTVREHLAFALTIRKWQPAAIDRRVDKLAELLQLRHLLPRFPAGLSGGESQRVALGRALAVGPRVLLFDEPLSALDAGTWDDMCVLLQRARSEAHATVLHITHSAAEAARLADRVLSLENGMVREVAKPEINVGKSEVCA